MAQEPVAAGRLRILAFLAAAELLGMAVWFGASAISPLLADLQGLTPSQQGWLTAVVQVGFVCGTAVAAFLNLADVLPSRTYFCLSSLLAGGANAVLLLDPGYSAMLLCRFVTGFALAGVYPPAMKMIATWFRSGRGLAIGTVVGALILGKATPFLVQWMDARNPHTVILTTSLGSFLAAVVVLLGYRDGPFAFEKRRFSWSLVGSIVRHRPTRLAILGYLGHMWELYAVWTWLPVYLAASLVASGRGNGDGAAGLLAFVAFTAGAVGSVLGGRLADRMGRERLVTISLVVSGACCLLAGPLFGGSLAILVPFLVVWGFFIVSDSAQFSTLVTEVAPSHGVGTALTLQTSIGFLLTVGSIQLLPRVLELGGWELAFAFLAPGPFLGILAVRRLVKARGAV